MKALAEGNVGGIWCELNECLDDTGVDCDDSREVDQRCVVTERRVNQRRRASDVVASRFPYEDAFDLATATANPELLCSCPLVSR